MTNNILEQATSFLASFKTFFFYTLTFIIFGSASLFLFQLLPNDYQLFEIVEIDFSSSQITFQFLVLSYIAGLILYAFSFLCYRSWYRFIQPQLSKIFKQAIHSNATEINDVEIIVYLEKHSGVADVYTLQLFYSLITRLLFSLVAFGTIFFAYDLYAWILGFITLLLFALGLSADKSVNEFGNQIKDVINKSK